MSEPLSDKERLLVATRKVVIDIMENGRQCYDGAGEPIPGKFTQPSAADIQAALKLLHREEIRNPKDGDGNPFAEADASTRAAISEAHGQTLPPDAVEDEEEWIVPTPSP